MGKFCYTYINTHTFAHIKINCVLITIYVCAKVKECILIKSYTNAIRPITCCIICTTIHPHGRMVDKL